MGEQRKSWPAEGKVGTETTEYVEQRGLRCPRCGCGHFRVIYTRSAWGGRIVRRRECRNCAKRVTTTKRFTD